MTSGTHSTFASSSITLAFFFWNSGNGHIGLYKVLHAAQTPPPPPLIRKSRVLYRQTASLLHLMPWGYIPGWAPSGVGVSTGMDHSFSWFNFAWTPISENWNLQKLNSFISRVAGRELGEELFQKSPGSCPSERHVLSLTNCFVLYSTKLYSTKPAWIPLISFSSPKSYMGLEITFRKMRNTHVP